CSIFRHTKVHDNFYLRWKKGLINYNIKILTNIFR
ncbi:hypothetical protein A5872_000391, partial [Enterococcus faecium]